jgi:hypothetical protein
MIGMYAVAGRSQHDTRTMDSDQVGNGQPHVQ